MRVGQAVVRTVALVSCCLLSLSLLQAATPGVGLRVLQGDRTAVALITPSDVDTLRMLDQFSWPGDTFALDIHVANVDTLGAYSIRLRYDPALIEPLTDTVVEAGDSAFVLDVQQLRGTAFEEFSGTVNEPGVLTMLAADFDLDTTEAFVPGSGVSGRMLWHVLPSAAAQTTNVVFEIHPQFPETFNTITDFYGNVLFRPVLTDGEVLILPGPCDCTLQGDLDADTFYNSTDLNLLISILFFNGTNPSDPTCPVLRGDWNCDGATNSSDLNRMIQHLFFSGPPPCDPCADGLP